MTHRAKTALARALATLCTIAVCGGNAVMAEPLKIRIGWIVTPAELSPIMLAPGVARHHGVSYTAEFIRFRGSTLQLTAVQSGELDIVALGSNSFPIAIENAQMTDLRIIADEVRDVAGYGGVEYRVLKDSPITRVEDLKGKVLAVNVRGGVSDIAVKAMMLKHNMVAEKDYTQIEVPMQNMSAFLLDRKADLVNSVHPFDLDPKYRAKSRVLFSGPDAVGSFELSMWTARTGFIAAHRAALVDLLEDYVRAFRWYKDPANHSKAVEIISNFTKIPKDSFEGWILTDKDYYRDRDAMPDLDAVNANIREERKLGLVKGEIDARNYADLNPLKEALERVK